MYFQYNMYIVLSHYRTADGHDILEAGVNYLAQGRLDIAFELLSEALVIFSQVYGPMHQATAICFRYYRIYLSIGIIYRNPLSSR